MALALHKLGASRVPNNRRQVWQKKGEKQRRVYTVFLAWVLPHTIWCAPVFACVHIIVFANDSWMSILVWSGRTRIDRLLWDRGYRKRHCWMWNCFVFFSLAVLANCKVLTVGRKKHTCGMPADKQHGGSWDPRELQKRTGGMSRTCFCFLPVNWCSGRSAFLLQEFFSSSLSACWYRCGSQAGIAKLFYAALWLEVRMSLCWTIISR